MAGCPLAHSKDSTLNAYRQDDGSLRVTAERRLESDDLDATALNWRILPAPEEDQEVALQKLSEKLELFDRSSRALRELLLVHGLPDSETIGLDPQGRYVVRATGEAVPFERAYEDFRNESPRNRHYLRAGLEIAALLGSGAVWYWWNDDFNSADWEYRFDWPSWRAKTYEGTGVRLDDNSIDTNIFRHTFSGAGYYTAARSNNLSTLESFLLAFAGSTLWEYVVEFREIVSLNDQILTPVAGTVIGEVFYQLGEFFRTSGDGPVNRILTHVFGGAATFNRWLSNESAARGRPLDRYGFRSDLWHRFEVYAGLGSAHASRKGTERASAIGEAGLSLELFPIPGFGAEGAASELLDQAAYAQLKLHAGLGTDGLEDLDFFVKAAFVGYYAQNLRPSGEGGLRGYSLFVGPSSAFELGHRDAPGNPDTMGIVNILGPTIDLTIRRGAFKIRMIVDVYGDFAAIRAYAVERYEQAVGLEGVKSVLKNQKYHYAYGLTAAARIEAEYGPVEVGAGYRGHFLESIDGLDRREEEAVADVHGSEKIVTLRGWVAYRLPLGSMRVAMQVERRWRSGWLGDYHASGKENRVSGNVILTY